MKMWKLFKSDIRLYYVEVDIIKGYSHYDAKLSVVLYNEDKTVEYAKYSKLISNYFKNKDLDDEVKFFINDYEDWKILD